MVLTNEETLLRTQVFPVCPCAQHLLRTQNLDPKHKKCLCPQQMFPGLRGMETKHIVMFLARLPAQETSRATVFPRLPPP